MLTVLLDPKDDQGEGTKASGTELKHQAARTEHRNNSVLFISAAQSSNEVLQNNKSEQVDLCCLSVVTECIKLITF